MGIKPPRIASMKTGGGTQTTTADMPADWRRQVDDELRDALKALDAENNIDRENGEFTAQDAVGIWAESRSGTQKKLVRLLADGKVTVRKAYDPECKSQVSAYRRVE